MAFAYRQFASLSLYSLKIAGSPLCTLSGTGERARERERDALESGGCESTCGYSDAIAEQPANICRELNK